MNSGLFSYAMERIAGVSVNNFRIPPQNSNQASANQQIRFSLPSACLLNTRSIKILFNATTTGTNARLPANMASLIDRYEVLCGGMQLSQGFSLYNVLVKAKESLEGSKCDGVLGHPEIIRETSYVTAVRYPPGDPETYASDQEPKFGVSLDEGFFGTVEPSVIDTGLLADLTLIVHLAGNEVLTVSPGLDLDDSGSATSFTTDVALTAAQRNGTYSLSDIRLTCEVIGLASTLLDQVTAKRIADIGFVPLNFKQYSQFMDTHNGDTKFSVACQSLDRVWVAYRDPNYFTQGAPICEAGFKVAGAFTSATSGGSATQDVGKPQFDVGGVSDTNREKYRGRYFNFTDRAVAKSTYQMMFNATMMPQYQATPGEMYQLSMNSVERSYNHSMLFNQHKSNNFVHCWRLCLPGNSVRILSGVDSRGVNLQASLRTTGLQPDTNVVIWVEHTSTLKVGAMRAAEAIL